MNRADFLSELRRGLDGLSRAESDDILADYESHFADGVAAGRSEQDIAQALGNPARLARELRAEAGFRRWESERSAGNFLGLVLALLGLATIDIMFLFPLLCGLAGILLGLGVACLALCAAGVFLLLSLLPLGWHPHMGGPLPQALAGIGLAAGGLGGGAALLLLIEWIVRLLVRYARLHYRLLDSANKSL